MRVTRNDFLKLGLSTLGTVYLGCSGTESDGGGTGGLSSSGGLSGSGASGGTTGGSPSGGAASGGEVSSGGSPSGGASSGGGTATGGTGTGDACGTAIAATSSGEKHTHDVSLTLEEIIAGIEVQKETTTASTHSHLITFTASDLATLREGGTITKTTCDGGDHEFVLSCATPNRIAALPTCCEGDSAANCPN